MRLQTKTNQVHSTTTTPSTKTITVMAKDKVKKGGNPIDENHIKDPREPNIRSPLHIWKYLIYEVHWILIGLVGAAAVGTIPVVLYFVLGNLIDGMTNTSTINPSKNLIVRAADGIRLTATFQANINNSAMWMAIIAALSFVAAGTQQFAMNLAHDRMGTRLKVAFFDKLLDQEIGYFDMKRTGELINELTEGMEAIQDAYSVKAGMFVSNCVQTILGVVLALNSGWKMALVMLSTAPLLAVLLGGTGLLVQGFSKWIGVISGHAASVANEVISSMRTVRSMDGEQREKDRFNTKLRRANFLYAFKATTLGASLGSASFAIWGVVALAFWYGGHLVLRAEMTIGQLFQVCSFFYIDCDV
jgi:ATP-binding cassette subfamily B (MDR/TAP) protein 1